MNSEDFYYSEYDHSYFSISPKMLLPEHKITFSLYLQKNKHFVLYKRKNETFTLKNKQFLTEQNISAVYVLQSERIQYTGYLEKTLPKALLNTNLSIKERSELFYISAIDVMHDIYDCNFTEDKKCVIQKAKHIAKNAVTLLQFENALKSISKIIEHDYKTHTHSVNVLVYATAVFLHLGIRGKKLQDWATGALLHDLGKIHVPRKILDKPSFLTDEERQIINTHPLRGLAACSMTSIPSDAMNIILFHHEKMDGSGYPCGLTAEEIPLQVRVVTIIDIFDAMSSERPYSRARRAFDVLDEMFNTMQDKLDLQILRRFVLVLSQIQASEKDIAI
ncbi:MAG: HD domain-containing protein [Desulfovibrionales bacterium]|nr:HD domain-containing protein [Desulfovibrionales bacterium]